MNAIPAFSIFSAVSELLVTAAVLYVIISNMRGDVLKWKLLFGTLAFEIFVNVSYMFYRTSAIAAETTEALTPALRTLAAFHGGLSFVMLLSLIMLSFIAYRQALLGRHYFQEHKAVSVIFIVWWLISVGSGELLFVLLYLT